MPLRAGSGRWRAEPLTGPRLPGDWPGRHHRPVTPGVLGVPALGQGDQILHDAVEGVVLRGVDGGHALAQQDLGVVGRDDPAHHHGGVDPGGPQAVEHVGHQLQVGAREDGEADDVDVLVPGRRHDLRRGQPDALVDDLEAGVAGGHGDLLGPVGVAVEAGLGHEQPGRAPGALGQGPGAGD